MSWFVNDTQKKNIWQDKSINEVIDDYILSPTNMKQNKTKPYQACFLSTYGIVSKDKYILSWFYSLICVCTYRSFIILLFQLSNKWHLFIHQYTAGFNYITMLISVAVDHCVASPLDIGTLEAGVNTNVKSGKFKFFWFSLFSTFCWQVKFCDVDS
jgi:hypothetical protein